VLFAIGAYAYVALVLSNVLGIPKQGPLFTLVVVVALPGYLASFVLIPWSIGTAISTFVMARTIDRSEWRPYRYRLVSGPLQISFGPDRWRTIHTLSRRQLQRWPFADEGTLELIPRGKSSVLYRISGSSRLRWGRIQLDLSDDVSPEAVREFLENAGVAASQTQGGAALAMQPVIVFRSYLGTGGLFGASGHRVGRVKHQYPRWRVFDGNNRLVVEVTREASGRCRVFDCDGHDVAHLHGRTVTAGRLEIARLRGNHERCSLIDRVIAKLASPKSVTVLEVSDDVSGVARLVALTVPCLAQTLPMPSSD
jgi:hypothetical protein